MRLESGVSKLGVLVVVKAPGLAEAIWGKGVSRVKSKSRAWGPEHLGFRKRRGSSKGDREGAAAVEGGDAAEGGPGSRRAWARCCVGPIQVHGRLSCPHQPVRLQREGSVRA